MSVVLKNTVLVTINGVKDNTELNTPKGRVLLLLGLFLFINPKNLFGMWLFTKIQYPRLYSNVADAIQPCCAGYTAMLWMF